MLEFKIKFPEGLSQDEIMVFVKAHFLEKMANYKEPPIRCEHCKSTINWAQDLLKEISAAKEVEMKHTDAISILNARLDFYEKKGEYANQTS